MPADPPVSGFLAQRAANARARARSLAQPAPMPGTPPQPAQAKPQSDPAPKSQPTRTKRTPTTPPPAQPTALSPSPSTPEMRAKGRGRNKPEPKLAESERSNALISAIRAVAKGDPALIGLVEPDLPAVFDAIVAGAKIPGSVGDRDRTRLFRILGLPWAERPLAADRSIAGGGAGASMSLLAQRIARAQSRVDGHRRVTVTQSVTVEDADDGQPAPVAHLSAEQARYPLIDLPPEDD